MLQIHQRSGEHLHKSKLQPWLSSSFTELPKTEGRRSRSALPHLQRTTIPYRPAHQELSPKSAADRDRPHSRTRGDAFECTGFRRKDREGEFDPSIDPAISHPDHHPSFQRSAAPFGIHPRLGKIRTTTTMATGGARKSENVTRTMKTTRGKSGSGRSMPSATTTRAPPSLARGRSTGESAPRMTPTLTTAIRMKRGRKRKRRRRRGVTLPRRPAGMTAQMTTTRRRRRRKKLSRSHRKVTTRNLTVLGNGNPSSTPPLPQQRLMNTIPAPGAPSIVLSSQKQYSSDGPRHHVRYAPPLISVKTVGL